MPLISMPRGQKPFTVAPDPSTVPIPAPVSEAEASLFRALADLSQELRRLGLQQENELAILLTRRDVEAVLTLVTETLNEAATATRLSSRITTPLTISAHHYALTQARTLLASLPPDDVREMLIRAAAGELGGPPGTTPPFSPPASSVPRLYLRTTLSRVNPRVAAFASSAAYDLIVQFSDELRSTVRALTTRAVTGEFTATDLARRLVRTLPLHSRFAQAVDNHYQGLLTSGATPSRARELADAYAERLRRTRSLNIARTEVMRAAEAGRRATWESVAELGLLTRADAGVEWLVGPSGWAGIDVCRKCAPLAGAIVPYGSWFNGPRGGVPGPPLHPSCRCATHILPRYYTDDRESGVR
jgi:hypothetical protein